jgi:hypothetical protein
MAETPQDLAAPTTAMQVHQYLIFFCTDQYLIWLLVHNYTMKDQTYL